jgi:hypothetical protein
VQRRCSSPVSTFAAASMLRTSHTFTNGNMTDTVPSVEPESLRGGACAVVSVLGSDHLSGQRRHGLRRLRPHRLKASGNGSEQQLLNASTSFQVPIRLSLPAGGVRRGLGSWEAGPGPRAARSGASRPFARTALPACQRGAAVALCLAHRAAGLGRGPPGPGAPGRRPSLGQTLPCCGVGGWPCGAALPADSGLGLEPRLGPPGGSEPASLSQH